MTSLPFSVPAVSRSTLFHWATLAATSWREASGGRPRSSSVPSAWQGKLSWMRTKPSAVLCRPPMDPQGSSRGCLSMS